MAGSLEIPSVGERDRFESKYEVSPGGCWNWTASLAANGYGAFMRGNAKQGRAHRIAYEFFIGPIPEDAWILHSCDNRKCVNPDHLRAGTPTENMQEAKARGRATPPPLHQGDSHPNSKLTAGKVREIRSLFDGGWIQNDIAAAYGVSEITVNRIGHRKAWSHLEEVAV